LLAAGPLAVVAASMFTIWLAVKSDDGLVASDYYKRGLPVNQRLPKATAPHTPLRATAAFAGDELTVLAQGETAPRDSLLAALVHPQSGSRQEVMLVRDSDGAYVGVAPPGPSGAWTVSFAGSQLPTTLVTRE
jgi:hypothetical protein